RFEPNDYRHQARTVTEGAYANLFGANPDYYRIRLNAGDTLLAGIVYDSRLADLDLAVLDPYGQLLSASSRAGDVDLCSVQRVPLAGWYYIRVIPSLLGSGSSPYDLLIGKTMDRKKLGARRWGLYR
ncbi:MAG: PPC domain-containing protein, partial [Candidatus Sumerlaeia bacterium]|nr:PPC domain-containing protein [Candidatus Sumerlaeia bacterium]